MIKVEINNQILSDVRNLSLNSSILALAEVVSFDVSSLSFTRFFLNDPIKIYYLEELIFSGILETKERTQDANSKTFKFSGRSFTADMIDATLSLEKPALKNTTPKLVADWVCGLHNVEHNITDTTIIPNLTINPTDTPKRILEKIAVKENALLFCSKGILQYSRPQENKPAFEITNLISFNEAISTSDRFYLLEINGTASLLEADAHAIIGQSIDDSIRKNRTKRILKNDLATNKEANAEAKLQQNLRISNSYNLSVSLAGGTNSEGFWQVNSFVRFETSEFTNAQQFLIKSLSFTWDGGIGTTRLNLINEPKNWQ